MLKRFLRDESGQDLVEYSLLLVIIGAVAVIALTAMGTSVSSIFSKMATKLSEVESQIPSS